MVRAAVSFWDCQWIFNVRLRYPVATTKIRWTVTRSSLAHLPNLDAASVRLIPEVGFSNIPGQTLQCSEIVVYEDHRTLAQIEPVAG